MSAKSNTLAPALLTRQQVENLLGRHGDTCATKVGNAALIKEAERVARTAARRRTLANVAALVNRDLNTYPVVIAYTKKASTQGTTVEFVWDEHDMIVVL